MQYAKDVVTDVAATGSRKMGFSPASWRQVGDEYELKEGEGSSHSVILEHARPATRRPVLDLGCSGGLLAEQLRDRGHHVTGVDYLEIPGVREARRRVRPGRPRAAASPRRSAPATTSSSPPTSSSTCATRRSCSREMGQLLGRGRPVIISVPNFGHWYPRVRTVLGLFDYDQRGILDKTHLRFFTRRSLLRMIKKNGFAVKRMEMTGLPVDVRLRRSGRSVKRLVLAVDALLVSSGRRCSPTSSWSRSSRCRRRALSCGPARSADARRGAGGQLRRRRPSTLGRPRSTGAEQALARVAFVGVALAASALLVALSRRVFLFWDDFLFLGEAQDADLDRAT